MNALYLTAPGGVGEVVEGADLAALALRHCELADGDVLAITSKVVSKAEGRRGTGPREEALAAETQRVVARRGPTTIVRNRLGLTMAAAGIDASNVAAGEHLLLPLDPDGTARTIREQIAERAGVNVAVLITDTAGRAWRTGQTDIAIGAAGLLVQEEFAGREDAYGNPLAVTAPAVADELAGAAELASGKLGGRPFVVIRGRADLVLDAGAHGTGAGVLNRPDGEDLFGLGARAAVVAALTGTQAVAFGAPAPAEDLAAALQEIGAGTVEVLPEQVRWVPAEGSMPPAAALAALGHAYAWHGELDAVVGGTVLFRPVVP
ncbi:coenzyme F420-0:L-glutamate ligase [Nocardioides dubius]|uniref:Coenzyme F420:L-glutamate ligase-like domain-containing protein n=1 Tax=Nocardioides dubius TaxID=317019 RepID=A0ABN1TK78_9ACTN